MDGERRVGKDGNVRDASGAVGDPPVRGRRWLAWSAVSDDGAAGGEPHETARSAGSLATHNAKRVARAGGSDDAT